MPIRDPHTEASTERGQLLPLQRSSLTNSARRPHRVGRSATVLAPWRIATQIVAEPKEHPTATDGALALVEQPLTAPRDEPVMEPRPAPARGAILIVEDDAHMAQLLRESLTLEGESHWDIHVAGDGARALEIASTTPPDVVLLDVLLPELDGAEVYRRLRAHDTTRAARILFLTAGTTFDLHQRGIEDGVLLRKPFDIRELASLVRALIEG